MSEIVAAVTGVGVVAPCGVGRDAFWDGLLGEAASGYQSVQDWDPSEFYANAKEARRHDKFAQFAIVSSTEALEQAGDLSSYDPSDIAVSYGSGIGGLATLEAQIGVQIEKGEKRVSPFLVPMMMANAAGAAVSLRHGAKGPCEAIVTACAAGTHSIGRALDWIRLGKANAVIAGSAESSLTPTGIAGFKNMTALSKSGDSKPFDETRDGFVISEGAGTLILERLDLAEGRGADILGLVIGSGSTADSHHITAPSPEGEGAIRCVNRALQDAGISATDVTYVNAHGTSTPLNDRAESNAMLEVFGDHKPAITSTKGVTGHALGAAGAMEAVSVILSMQNKKIPATAGLTTVDPEMPELDFVTEARDWEPGPTISNSFGFGGHNGTVVFAPYKQ